MEITLHPQFATNQFVYLSYPKAVGPAPAPPAPGGAGGGRGGGQQSVLAVARGRWDGKALADVKDVFVAQNGVGGPARMAFGRDGTLYVTTGGVDSGAQDPNSQAGKVLRLNDDGTVPPDNPFVKHAGYAPEVYTLGHRSSLGLAVHPGTGEIWQNENGPNGGDEINILKPGANYGWPIVSFGRTYPGPWQSPKLSREGFEQPIVFWVPSIAVSGMAFYTGDRLPKWKGDVFVGALRMGEIPGTGHLQRILFNEKMEELRPRVAARAAASAHPRRAAGTRRAAVRADRRSEGWRTAANRTCALVTQRPISNFQLPGSPVPWELAVGNWRLGRSRNYLSGGVSFDEREIDHQVVGHCFQDVPDVGAGGRLGQPHAEVCPEHRFARHCRARDLGFQFLDVHAMAGEHA